MLHLFYNALMVSLLSLLLIPEGTQATSCSFMYGDWSPCNATTGEQHRTVSCLCEKRTVDLEMCKNLIPENVTRPCTTDSTPSSLSPSSELCDWKWTKWSRCSVECQSGNTSRSQVCVCKSSEGSDEAVENDLCSMTDYYGDEVAECNTFDCASVPSFNKLYWTRTNAPWPISDGTFNCSQSVPPSDSPKGKTYREILETDPTEHPYNKEWYYLAKEWVACTLNIANGAELLPESAPVYARVTELLEYCDHLPTTNQEVYALKEKLGRINNNIGGLQNVDEQMALYASGHASGTGGGGGGEGGEGQARPVTPFLLMIILISLAILIIVVAVIVFVVYRYRRSSYSQVEKGKEGEEEMKDKTRLTPGKGGIEYPRDVDRSESEDEDDNRSDE